MHSLRLLQTDDAILLLLMHPKRVVRGLDLFG